MKDRPDELDESAVEATFNAALGFKPEERAAYLAGACSNNSRLYQRVEALLQAHEAAEGFLPQQPDGENTMAEVSERAGDQIGRYKLLQRIGEGGFGVVYMAEQSEPVRRRVALKIIKLGMDTKQVIARFEAERQALAMMDHPNIAKVHDAGATESGRPYFVMELVKGVPVNEYSDKNHLTLQERLELFIQIGQAIQHAHQKGIIHRDIKPSNVMVTLHDGRPVPKIIDFGIAKATNHRLTEKTLFTDYAQMLGTPAYMSPEQAEMSGLDVDTRTDVYSLGVLLYELLIGRTPFLGKDLLNKGYAEMQRIIREVDAQRPSTRMSTMHGEELTIVAKNRGSRPEVLRKFLKGDLDWIVMKALEKDRRRRYETANELVADVERHLRNEPVLATPPSQVYKLRKFIQRNRLVVSTGVVVAATIVVGGCISTWLAIRATQAEREARLQAAEALRQKVSLAAVNEFYVKDILGQTDAYSADQTPFANVTLREVLERAGAKIDGRFPEQPLVEASVRLTVGKALWQVARPEEAEAQLRQAYDLYKRELGSEHPETLETEAELGRYLSLGETGARHEEGLQMLQHAIEGLRNSPEASDAVIVDVMATLGWQSYRAGSTETADALLSEAVELATDRLAESHWLRNTTLLKLAGLREGQGRAFEGRNLYRTVWEATRGRGSRTLLAAEASHGYAHYLWWFDRQHEQAAGILKEGLEITRDIVGEAAPAPHLYRQLVDLRLDQGRFEEALEPLARGMALIEGYYARNHPYTIRTGRWVASVPGRIGDWSGVVTELENQRNRGIVDGESLAAELLVRHLAGQTDGTSALRRNLWDWLSGDPEEAVTFQTALLLLVLPCPADEEAQLLALVKRVGSGQGAMSPSWLQLRLLRGAAAFRAENRAVALEQLTPVTYTLADRRLATLARYFVAMALHGSQQATEAQAEVSRANVLLNKLLLCGDLDPQPRQSRWQYPTNGTWEPLGCCLVARTEAEKLILGREHSEPVTSDSLRASRAAWVPVRESLQQADWAARNRDWAAARELYLEVSDHPLFDIESANQQFPYLDLRMGTVFLLAGDTERYVRLCRSAVESPEAPGVLTPLSLLLHPDLPDAGIRSVGLELAQRALQEAAPGLKSGGEPSLPWHRETLGAALFRNGQSAEALRELAIAMKATEQDCVIRATVTAAMAEQALGRNEPARQYLAKAEEGCRIMTEVSGDMLAPEWWDQAIIELFLKEARRVIASTD